MIQQTQADRSSDFRNAQSGAGNAAASNYYSPQSGMGSSSDDEITIDLAELFGVLWHWIWLILLVALLFGGAAFAFSKFVIPEEFQSTTKIYVLDKESGSGGQSTYTDLQVGSQLTKDYAELITSRTVIDNDTGLAKDLTSENNTETQTEKETGLEPEEETESEMQDMTADVSEEAQ